MRSKNMLHITCLSAAIAILLCLKLSAYSSGGGSETFEEIPSLSVEQLGSRVTISWPPIADATGYKLYYALHPETDMANYIDMGAERSFSLELTSTSAYNVAVKALYGNNLEGSLSNVKSFGIQKAKRIYGKKRTTLEELSGEVLCLFDLNGRLLQEKMDLTIFDVTELTRNYSYELFNGHSFLHRVEFQLSKDVWLIKIYRKYASEPAKKTSDTYYDDSFHLKSYTTRVSTLVVKSDDDIIYTCEHDNNWNIISESFRGGGNHHYDSYGNDIGEKAGNEPEETYYTSDYVFDDNGNIIWDKRDMDSEGVGKTSYEYFYDDQNRKTRESFYRGNSRQKDSFFYYDEKGRLIRVVEKTTGGILEYTYTHY